MRTAREAVAACLLVLVTCLFILLTPSTSWGLEDTPSPSSDPTLSEPSSPSSSPSGEPLPSASGSPSSFSESSEPSPSPTTSDMPAPTETVTVTDSPEVPEVMAAMAEEGVMPVELSETDRVILLFGFGTLLTLATALVVSTWGGDS